jgi:signal transduction histidine kinase
VRSATIGCMRSRHERADESAIGDAADAEPLTELEATRRLLRRVRFDIHDGPLQELAAMTHNLHLLRLELPTTCSPEMRGRLEQPIDELLDRLDSMADDLRGIARATAASHECEGSLADALRRTAALYRDACRIDVSAELDDERALTASQRIAVSRIVQTSLANVAQHSGATRASVDVSDTAHGLVVEVFDNGCGFDVDRCFRRAVSTGRLGLSGIVERVELLGGSVDVDSRIGGPTTVRVFLPRVTLGRAVSATAAVTAPDVAPA